MKNKMNVKKMRISSNKITFKQIFHLFTSYLHHPNKLNVINRFPNLP